MSALTPRQIEILALVAELPSQREVARRLHVTDACVSITLVTVRRKLGVTSTPRAVLVARRQGLIP